jgi:small subunit ribosomal protein S20
MANTKSAIKATRKSARNAARNQTIKTRLKTLAKAVQQAAAGTDAEVARAAAIAYSSALDKAVKGQVIHRNAASHHKSQYAKLIFAAKK